MSRRMPGSSATARALSRRVEMVVVDDDIALPDAVQARGVAGSALARVVPIGMSLDTCRVPGSPTERRIADGEAQPGLGIHGEPGIERVAFRGSARRCGWCSTGCGRT